MSEIIELTKLLKAHHITPTKKFGQNFLVNANIISNITRSLGDVTNANILEIGPRTDKHLNTFSIQDILRH